MGMRFRKDGQVFEDIADAYDWFDCHGITCEDCTLGRARCETTWVKAHPAESARLMGYEVVEDVPDINVGEKEANMDKQKPRICEVLGVEVEEKFRVESDSCILYPEAFIDGDGVVRASAGQAMDGMRICQLISGELRLVRKPRFTEEEVADARAIVRLFGVTYDRVVKDGDSNLYIDHSEEPFTEPVMLRQIFPSIHPGSSVRLSDIVGGEV